MRHFSKRLSLILLLTFPFLGFSQKARIDSTETERLLKKIKFDVNEIDENGMIGLPDSKRNMAYEFCIPLDRKKRRKVSKIDPSVKFFSGPSGRSGCSGQYLCIGSGGTRKILLKLSKLEYIKVINPCYYE